MATKFSEVYNRFLGKITDDMYIELTPKDTNKDLQNLIIEAIPGFEFPRKVLDDYTIKTKTLNKQEIEEGAESLGFILEDTEEEIIIDDSEFAVDLDSEEINIIAILMMINWVQRQVTSIENTRMKYSGSDFKMTSQANHLSKLLTLLTEVQRQSHHMQRLYKRRKKDETGQYSSNWSVLREKSAIN